MPNHSSLDTTIPQTGATMFIQNNQLTENIRQCIRHQLYDNNLQKYLQNKYAWSDKTFHNINWKAHRTLIHKHKTPKDRVQILKGIHGWRPTKHRLHVINKKRKTNQQEDTTDLCLLCKQHQETQQHIFQCSQKHERINRIKGLWQIRT